MSENYKFTQNKKCEYFPCHKGIDPELFNCLFCYCPLYMLKNECGGNYSLKNGVKDCSECNKPHGKEGYDFVMRKIRLVVERGSDF